MMPGAAPHVIVSNPTGAAAGAPPPSPPRRLGRWREALRVRHHALHSERTCVDCARRCNLFHCQRHPASQSAADLTAFLSHLAVVLTPAEVRALLNELDGSRDPVAALLYGTGLRLLESLRVQDAEPSAANCWCTTARAARTG